ncbi:MAG TPA: SDR family oxidoreductase [Bacteroidales bacterium]|jgi:NADP-dependent 3-hydroxy acid dehydrogenase YdfG|nr:SDR family oxidoreductase [Bacteroidales bacterium]OPZ57608.1 MAG: NADP-dependent 3-hydroxy acid dehydrogenase YdfG [Bacteroidetes bacterium ADurb.BinA012]MBK7733659.1 SDR family oxidoreductase [Bacteroidales bacterium]MBP7036872.1 SDR family oxidoreductase [Bacteroidales bacterium]MBP8708659.1 SDR family oxidoreductase [Bacteroidales bacterium]
MQKTVLITGATSGIGEATAVKFAESSDRLIITGRRKERLDELADHLRKTYGTEVLTLCFDVRNRHEVEEHLGALAEEWKKIDILINNAGLAVGLSHIDEGDTDDWDRMIDTNVKGLLYITRIVVPLMVARGTGHIFNIASIAGKEVYENGAVYCASKHAVDALSKAMRIDLLKHGIKVTNIAPGMVETEFSEVRFKGDTERAATVYAGLRPLTGDDIAGVIHYCASLPDHVCINDVLITPKAQANATITFRKTGQP